MSSFDPSFDPTFHPATPPLTDDVPLFADCLPTGYMLYWLTNRGWASWLFDGRAVRGKSVRSMGSYTTNRTLKDTQRESTPTMLFRTSGLSRVEADVLDTLSDSVAVYWLRESDGNIAAYPIYVAAGEYTVWNEADKTGTLEIRATLDSTRSLRN